MEEYALELKNVSWKYEEAPNIEEYQLKNINLKIKKGEYVGIIGANNSGKSTLCNLCNGLIPKSITGEFTGTVLVEGKDISNMTVPQVSEWVGYVLSDPEAQLSQITVYDELTFGPSNMNIEKKQILKKADEIVKLLSLEELKDRNPFSLSGGQMQRVAIASVLTMEPKILVLDEPTSNLDPIGTKEIFKTVASLNKELGMTVVMVEHEMETMARYVDRFIVLDKGEVILDGTPEEVFKHRDVFERIGIFIPNVTEIAYLADTKYNCWHEDKYPVSIRQMYEVIDKNAKNMNKEEGEE